MAMTLGNKKGVQCNINITPYIDILLVLLIIFMVAAPLKQHEEQIRVPQNAVTPREKQQVKDILVVDIDIDRKLRLNQQDITLDALGNTLSQLFSRRVNKSLLIRGDSELPYGDVFKVLDLAKRSGAGDIALVQSGAAHPDNAARADTAPPAGRRTHAPANATAMLRR
jgi:biopolymer transport protein ExbD